MSPFAILVLCIQACLIQTAFSQCSGSINYGQLNQGYRAGASSFSSSNLASSSSCGSYGGSGPGQVSVNGPICADGTSTVTGSVPVLGSVSFSGTAPASGSVSICGQCGCGCA